MSKVVQFPGSERSEFPNLPEVFDIEGYSKTELGELNKSLGREHVMPKIALYAGTLIADHFLIGVAEGPVKAGLYGVFGVSGVLMMNRIRDYRTQKQMDKYIANKAELAELQAEHARLKEIEARMPKLPLLAIQGAKED